MHDSPVRPEQDGETDTPLPLASLDPTGKPRQPT